VYQSLCELRVSDVYVNAWRFGIKTKTPTPERPPYRRIHQHHYYEIFFVADKLSINIENVICNYKNQIVILPPWKSHYALVDNMFYGCSMMFTLEQMEGKNKGLFSRLAETIQDTITVLPMNERVRVYSENFVEAMQRGEEAKYSLLTSLLFLEIFSELFPQEKLAFEETESRNTNLTKLDNYISGLFNEDISLDSVAEEMGLSARRISGIIKEKYGCTFTQLIHRKRLGVSAVLLKTTEMTVSNISQAVGYENENYFFQCFRNEYGMSPQQYRNSTMDK